jgi:ribA/ribD-fused uncharacterized protein
MTSRQTRSSYAKASGSASTSNPADRAEARVSKSKSKFSSVSKALAAASSNSETSKKGAKPIYFWREYGSPNCYLSQWYASPFYAEHSPGGKEIIYQTAEQYMMHRKALLFQDYTVAAKILTISSPKAVKGLGRKVKPFNQATWDAHRSKIVEDASYYKFKFGVDEGDLSVEGKTLKERLLETGDKEIVEASPVCRTGKKKQVMRMLI